MQKWNGYRPSITRKLLEEFRAYLIQKKIDLDNHNHQNKKFISRRKKFKHYNNNNNNDKYYYYEWIEKKILTNPFPDCRKIIVDLILAPYLINIKKLSYQESYQIIREWLDKCNSVRRLDQNFNYRISYALKNALNKPQIRPMSQEKIKIDYKYRNLYILILNQ